jgi:hypothetical protein
MALTYGQLSVNSPPGCVDARAEIVKSNGYRTQAGREKADARDVPNDLLGISYWSSKRCLPCGPLSLIPNCVTSSENVHRYAYTCAGCADNDQSDHQCGRCLVRERSGAQPWAQNSRRRHSISGLWYPQLRSSRKMAAPSRTETFVELFFEEPGIAIDWQLGEQVWRSAGRVFRAYAAPS